MQIQTFHAEGNWQGTLATGKGMLNVGSLASIISVPQDLGGLGKGTNPEDLIVGASTSCFIITLSAIFQFNKIEYENISVNSEADFSITPMGPKLKEIRHFVSIQSSHDLPRETVDKYIKQAEKGCMISIALSGNVEVTAQLN
ncbi:OsmC family protein [Xenorhabdus sp. SGI246]|uniref:OsmC family protein n=1 Tax=Xenorhabdus sp. SGI246 TaxID=3158263 RepID=UPI00349F911B